MDKIRLLADENIPDELIDLLRKCGYDILEVMPGTKDPAVASLAKKEQRILITQDKDFSNILEYPPKNFHGIVRLKFHPPVITDMVAAIEDLFRKYPTRDLDKRLVVLERNGLRIR